MLPQIQRREHQNLHSYFFLFCHFSYRKRSAAEAAKAQNKDNVI